MTQHYQHLIVGQGIAGSLLAYQLLKENRSVLVVDNGSTNTSSHIAAGMFTPVSGKRMVKTWMAETLLEGMTQTYNNLQALLNEQFLHNLNIQLSFSSIKEQNDFFSSLDKNIQEYVSLNIEPEPGLQAPFGAVEIHSSGWLNTSLFLSSFKHWLEQQQRLLTTHFNHGQLQQQPNGLWKYGEVYAEQVIFCEGHRMVHNPLFPFLAIIENKGDVFRIKTSVFSGEKIYKRGSYAVQLASGEFKVGSTYKWNVSDDTPDEAGFEELKLKTDALINGPYEVVSHLAGIRPTTRDRRPVLGEHPTLNNLFVFNGLGSKGVLLAPHFSRVMTNYLLHRTEPEPSIHLKRFIPKA